MSTVICLLRPRLRNVVEAPPREKAEAQHHSEDLSNCTWFFNRANKSYGLFMLGHTDVLVFSSFVVTEKSKLSLRDVLFAYGNDDR